MSDSPNTETSSNEPEETISSDQADRVGDLYTQALSNYDDFGTFQLALSNSMSGRSFNWDIDQMERVLRAMVALGASTSVPRDEDWKAWDEFMARERRNSDSSDSTSDS